MRLLKTICLAAALAATTALSFAQPAQDYPAKPIKIIVPFAAGGVVDALPRALAPELERRLGQPIIVESKPGAGSMVGAEFVAKSAPDGYTLLLATSSTLAVGPHLYKNLRFDMDRDLTPGTMIAISPSILMVRSDAPVDTFKRVACAVQVQARRAVVRLGRRRRRDASAQRTVHGRDRHQADPRAVPGCEPRDRRPADGPGRDDDRHARLEHRPRQGRQAQGARRDDRQAAARCCPTCLRWRKLGYPQLAGDIWFALSAPAQTPPAIIERLQREVSAIVRSPAYREKFRPVGLDMVGGTSEEMAATVRRDGERWSRVIREANVKVD